MARSKGMQMVETLNRMMGTHDLQEIINLGRTLVDNPLILSNASYTVMAMTEEPSIRDPRWIEIQEAKGIPIGLITNSEINACYRKSIDEHRPVLHIPGETNMGGVPMLRMALATGDRVLGYLDSPCYIGTYTEEEIEVFGFLGNLLTVELQRDLNRAIIPDNMLDYFVYDLLEGKITDPKLINERFDFFKWNIRSQGKVQIVSICGRAAPLMPDNTHFRTLLETLISAFPMYKSFVYGSEIKTICPVKESLQSDAHFERVLSEILRRENLVAGVSRPLVTITSIADFNRQAEKAAELGKRLKPEQDIYFYDNFAIYHALQLASEEENMLQFCHSAIMLLRDYDLAHDTNLLESLHVYLTRNRSIGESAAALFIHRNTMNYRIAKINELTNIDLNDPDVLCHLLFSFYALDYRKLLVGEREEIPPESRWSEEGQIQ